MLMLDAVHDLIAEGFAVVPISREGKAKQPLDRDDWRTRTYTAEHFRGEVNVAVKCGAPSGHRVDVDLDAIEAVRAGELLPFTRVHGRAGKPASHFWYVCPDLKSMQFRDVNEKTLLELRGTGEYTVVPPSVHESGDVIAWENRLPFLPMSVEDLKRVGAEIATVAILARHWPGGSRHFAALHVGGFLARLGIEPAHVERLVTLMATIASDEEVADRARAARESAERHNRGEATTGGARLTEMLSQGHAVLRRIYTWFGREGEDQIEDMNSKHFVVQIGGKMVVGTEQDDQVGFQPFMSFREKYCNQFVGKRALGDAWLRHPSRREFESVVFAPPHARWAAGPRDYNLWRGFGVTPATHPHPERQCQRYLEHAYEVIGNQNTEYGTYILDLLADIVQKPGRLIGKTLCMRGPQGVGKSIFAEQFGWLFGKRHFFIVSSRDQLVGQFNAHLSGRVVVFADEAVWGGNKADEGALKRLVTQDTLTIRRLYVDAVMEQNCAHLLMAADSDWPFPAGNMERRLVVLDVAEKHSEAYYASLWQEVRAPGFHEALLATLLDRSVDEERLRRGLDTRALAEIKQLSAPPVQQWWYQQLENGELTPGEGWPPYLPTESMYQQYCDDMGHRRAGFKPGSQWMFSRQLQKFLPGNPKSTKHYCMINIGRPGGPIEYAKRSVNSYDLAPLDTCRAHFDRVTGSTHDWPIDQGTLFPE